MIDLKAALTQALIPHIFILISLLALTLDNYVAMYLNKHTTNN